MFRKIFAKPLIGFAIALGATAAAASPCNQVLQDYSNDPVLYGYLKDYHPECFAGSSSTSAVQILATSFAQSGAISQALTSRIRGATPGPIALGEGVAGLAAGNGKQAWNVWGSHNTNSSSVRVNNGAGRNDSDTGTTVLGADYALTPMMSAGVSLAIDRTNGSNLAGNVTKNKGYTVAPYLGYQLSKELSLDISAGMGYGEFSSAGTTADADRWFGSANLGYSKWNGNWQLTGKASYLHGEEKYENSKLNGAVLVNTASKNRMDQVRVGAQAAYWMNGVMPYAGLTYAADIRRASTLAAPVDPLGRRAYVLDLGLNFISVASKLTGAVAFQQEFNRTNSKNQTLMANVNVRF